MLLNFRSQFAPGYNYPNDSIAISKFLAPGYITLALGMDYKPNDNFSLFISPATVRFLIVNDDLLSRLGAFGVDSGKKVKTEVGAYVKAAYKKEFTKNTALLTSVDFFSNYLKNPGNIDINWQLLFTTKITRFISVNVSTQLIYDDDTKVQIYNNDDTPIPGYFGPRVQFKEFIGIGFAYNITGFTVR